MLPAPQSLMAPSPPEVLYAIVAASPLASQYAEAVDRESAYERLTGKIAAGPGEPLAPAQTEAMTEEQRLEAEILGRLPTPTVPPPTPAPRETSRSRAKPAPSEDGGLIEQVLGSSAFEGFLKSAGATLAREISRGMFGNRRRR
jgi:hypothetical protein